VDLLNNLALGFGAAFTAQNLLCAFFGSVLGTLIGVLPGLGPVATIAMLLPSIYSLDATPALIMLATVYCGARHGHARATVAAAGLGSFFAGSVGALVLAICSPPLVALAFQFGPAEYFSLTVLVLIGTVVLGSGSLIKAIAMMVLGLLLGQLNSDLAAAVPRFSFQLPELSRGVGFVSMVVGMFGLGRIVIQLGMPAQARDRLTQDLRGAWPTLEDIQAITPAVIRGTALGSVLGVLPGGGVLLASFAADSVEKRAPPGEVTWGIDHGRAVAGHESANAAALQTSFVPLLTLGLPTNVVMALILGAMTIKGIEPGPQLMAANPQLFWGLIASMSLGQLILLALNLPPIGLWRRLLAVPYRWLFPGVTVVCCIGLYTLDQSGVGIYLGAFFALVGYVFHKLGCEPAPLLLGYLLGPMLEQHLQHALQLSSGDWGTFVAHPLSAGLLVAAALLAVLAILPSIRARRELAFQEQG